MENVIKLVHGNGGKYSQELVNEVILPHFNNEFLEPLHDGAQFQVEKGRMAFSTDSYVVKPLFFPGGNIGKLAICGTINDLTMNGAIPQYLSCSFIIEEGFSIDLLRKIVASMGEEAKKADVKIVTGDTKVVEKGAIDGIYINTAGVGFIPDNVNINYSAVTSDMDIILTGSIGDHAISVMGTRYDLTLPDSVITDCAALNKMINAALSAYPQAIALMRDPTRGGLGTSLCEIAEKINLGILIDENQLIVRDEVKAVCDILGYDPLYLANEGKAILFVDKNFTTEVLNTLKKYPEGKDSKVIGHTLAENRGMVGLKTVLGGIRVLDSLGYDQVPRIC